MKPIIGALKEVRAALVQITLFTCLIDTFILFLILALAAVLVSLPWWYAIPPALLYSGMHTTRGIRKRNLAYVEEKTPELRERLTTAADNIDKENIVVQSLQQDVLRAMRSIKTSSFLSFGRLARQLITMTVVSILIITASAHHIRFLDFRKTVSELGKLGEAPGQYGLDENLEFIENLTEDIYGNKSLQELGAQEMQIELTPVMSDIDIGKVKPPESREFTSTLPPEIKATTDVSFQESIPKGYQRIVKSYFREIAKTS